MKYFLYLLSIIFALNFTLISCENKAEKQEPAQSSQPINTSLYGNTSFVFPEFSENTKIEVSHWGAFGDFEAEAKTLNGNTIENIQLKTKQLVHHLDSLSKSIPDTLNTKAIYSRVMVVKTRVNLLDQEVKKAHIDSIKLQDSFNEMNIAVKNLLVQINEKFQKDNIDLQRIDNEKQELENQKRFLDSVHQVELLDKNKKQ